MTEEKKHLAAGNTATGWLKIIALVFMLCDHLGAVVFPNVPQLRLLGRIALPIYCWCMVVGFQYTRSVPQYLLRVLAVGVLSQPIYIIAMNHPGTPPAQSGRIIAFVFRYLIGSRPNIFFTLFLGLAALWCIREKKFFSHIWGPVVMLFLANIIRADYGWKGVLFILLLYGARTSRPAISALMISYFLYWGTGYRESYLFTLPFSLDDLPTAVSTVISSFIRFETYGLLALPLILIRFPYDLKIPKWLGYLLYPAHLVLIIFVKAVLL